MNTNFVQNTKILTTLNGQKAVKYTLDVSAIDSNRSIDFEDTVNMQKNTKK